MAFYASPPPLDRKCFTLDSTGYSMMHAVPVRFRRETWRSWQFMFTKAGEGIGEIDGAPFHARENTVTIMPPDKNHGYQPAPGCKMWEYRWIEFSGDATVDFLKMFGLFGCSHIHGCRDAWPAVEEVVTTLESGGVTPRCTNRQRSFSACFRSSNGMCVRIAHTDRLCSRSITLPSVSSPIISKERSPCATSREPSIRARTTSSASSNATIA